MQRPVTVKDIVVGDIVVSRFGGNMLAVGDVIDIWSSKPQLPPWAKKWWWQDGDIAIFVWACNLVGRTFWVHKSTHTVTKIENLTLTLGDA